MPEDPVESFHAAASIILCDTIDTRLASPEMKKLLHKVFGGRSAANKPALTEDSARSHAARLRQAVDHAATEADRTLRERDLGDLLGRAGIAPMANDSAEVWIAATCSVADRGQALAWVDGVTDEDVLERLALDARSTQVRLAAVQRMADAQRIQRLAAAMREKDRGVYRYCQSFLKNHTEKARRADQIDVLRRRLHQVLEKAPLPTAPLYDLRKLIGQLGDGLDLAECRALLDQANRREQEDVNHRRRLETTLNHAKGLLATLSGDPWPVADHLDVWKQTASQLTTSAASLPAWLASEQAFAELSKALSTLDATLSRLDADVRRALVCEQFLADHPDAHPGSELAPAWDELPKPESQAARNLLTEQWTARSVRALQQRSTAAASWRLSAADTADLGKSLATLEQAIANGETRHAFTLAKALDQHVAATGLPRGIAKRYRRVQGQLFHLRDWARWSDGQAREQLVTAAEALLAAPVDVEHLAAEVPRLRAAWKKLEGDRHASSAQWTRFDAALTQAYQPVLTDRADRLARLDMARQVKTAFLDQAEQWLQSIDWQNARFADIQTQMAALRERWRGLSPAASRHERKLWERYRTLMTALDQKIQPCIDHEFDRRGRLIAAANRLHQMTDLGEAVSEARLLQQRWRDEASGVRLPRHESDRQWQQFREALDRVFARRDAERSQRQATLQEQTAARSSVLTDFERTLDGHPDLHRVETALADFRRRWESDERTARTARRGADGMTKKAALLLRRAEALIRSLRNTRQREIFHLIARKAALAEELETAAAAGQPLEDLSQRIHNDWEQAGSLPGDIERRLTARLKAAPTATPSALTAGHSQRNDLLIDLEILLDLPTSSEFSEARRVRQLALLQSGVQHLKTPSALMGMLVSWFSLACPPDPTQGERIGRVATQLQALMAADDGTKPPDRPP